MDADNSNSGILKWRHITFLLFVGTLAYACVIFLTVLYTKKTVHYEIVDGSYIYTCLQSEGFHWDIARKVNELFYDSCAPLKLNELGDFLAGSLSFIALVWAALGFFWQSREFALQRKEYEKSNVILQAQVDQYLKKDSREHQWQLEQTILEEIKYCRQKLVSVKNLARYIHERYPHLNIRSPQTHSAVISVIMAGITMADGAHDVVDSDLERTKGDLDELKSVIEYILRSIEANSIQQSIPLSQMQYEQFVSVLDAINNADI